MKKITALILSAVILTLSFVSCAEKVTEEGNVTVVIEDEKGNYEVFMTYFETVENKHEGLLAIIKNLHARPRNPLHVKYTEEAFNPHISEIGKLKEDITSGRFIVFYTSNETDSSYGSPTVSYGETMLHLSGVGVEMATVAAGSVFLFRLEEKPL